MVASPRLETRLAELMMAQLDPCDLGDGIEVVHDVEAIEIEMECDLGDDGIAEVHAHGEADQTMELSRDAIEELAALAAAPDEGGTREFIRFSAPYERIELELEPLAFLRATIEEARATAPR